MPAVPVSKIKIGEKIVDPVLTRRGSLLFEKDTQVTPRVLEILRAFMIPSVTVGTKESPLAEDSSSTPAHQDDTSSIPTDFVDEYGAMFTMYRRVLSHSRSGGDLPVMEIRTRLKSLLQHMDSYNILTFVPPELVLRDYLIHNSILVAMTSYQLAKWHGLPANDWLPVALGGLLHDIGNVRIDESILEKTSKLTPNELEQMRKHTVNGYQILKNIAGLNEGIKMSALQHHEREDGTGYPLGVHGNKIHPYAKIIAVADIFHAMTSHRFHKKAVSPYVVLEQLHNESFGKLDPVIVLTFIQKVTQLNNGTLVRLNDNRIGEIVFSDRNNPTRPLVNVNGTIVNLTVERNVFIEEVIHQIG